MNRKSSTLVLSFILALTGTASGAACAPLTLRVADPQQATNFTDALHACRMKQPGRLNKRLNLAPDNTYVAACLKRAGWQTDGTRLQQAASPNSTSTR